MKPVEHPSDVVKVGDAIDVVVAQADPVSHKIGLHPAPTGEAANEAPQRVQMHKPVKVQVIGDRARWARRPHPRRDGSAREGLTSRRWRPVRPEAPSFASRFPWA